MKIHLQYFAGLRTQAGRSEETVETLAVSASALWDELRARYAWKVDRAHCAVAVNDVYASWDAQLSEGDKLVFLTPISGG